MCNAKNCNQCDNRSTCRSENKCIKLKLYTPKKRNFTPYERTKAQVYATGNKWVIENFNATH